jgi:hypothetical protein
LANYTAGKGANRPWALGTSIYNEVKLRKWGKIGFFQFFLPVYRPNNGFENTSYLLLFNSVTKKLFLGRKILEGHLPTPMYPPPKLRL